MNNNAYSYTDHYTHMHITKYAYSLLAELHMKGQYFGTKEW